MTITRCFQITTIVTLVATVGIWAATGAHRGWTQHHIPVSVFDPITEIEAIHYESGFVAGIDFLVLGAGVAAGCGAVAWWTSRRRRIPTHA